MITTYNTTASGTGRCMIRWREHVLQQKIALWTGAQVIGLNTVHYSVEWCVIEVYR